MRYQNLAWLPVVIVLSLNCSDKITSPQYFNQFPLRVGMFWEYQSTNYTLSKEITSYEKMPNGKWAYKQRTILTSKSSSSPSSEQSNGFTYLSFQEDQLREYYNPDCPSAYSILLEFPLQINQGWYKYHGVCSEVIACETTETGTIICSIRGYIPLPTWDTVMATADVSTPYGEFINSVGIKETGGLPFYKLIWFKPYTGFVKYEKYGLSISEDFVLTNFGVRKIRKPPAA